MTAKEFLKEKIRRVICKRNTIPNGKRKGGGIYEIPLKLSMIKPIHARCLLGLYDCKFNSGAIRPVGS